MVWLKPIHYILHVTLFFGLIQAYSTINDATLRAISRPGDDFDIKTGKLLAPILRPRVPGTPGSTAVLNHFVDFFKTSLPKWEISFQNSTSKTPVTGDKDIPFVNLIVSRDPPWSTPGEVSRLTLVAHYDSKLTPTGFIGAIDSAAPCAMLMHVARSLDAALTKKWSAMQAEEKVEQGFLGIEEHKGIQILFLDGEEAFRDNWSHEDSLYGARSLAVSMESTPHPATSIYHNALSSISLFVLLDLLGAAQPAIHSWFKTTHWAYRKMAALEKRFRDLSVFASSGDSWFVDGGRDEISPRGAIEDDHLPFMARGVEILHLIAVPFPRVWHNMDDDGEHLDMKTVTDWSLLVTAFAAEWMELDGFLEVKNAPDGRNIGSSDEGHKAENIDRSEL